MRQLYAQENDENASGTLVNYLERQLRNHSLESSAQNSVDEAIESERHRLQNPESSLAFEARQWEQKHQQEVIDMQKQIGAASKHSQ